MEFPLDMWQVAAAWAAVAFGAIVQAATGIGAGLMVVPMMTLIDPVLVPGPVVLSALSLNITLTAQGRRTVDFPGLWPIVLGMTAGSAAALPLVAAIEGPESQLVFGLMVLIAVGISAFGVTIAVTRRSMLAAGALSAFMGTTAAIGGPILALLYQHRSGPEIRATLAFLYMAGSVIILAALAVAGRLGTAELAAALALVPGWLAGYRVAAPIARWLDGGRMRPAVLVVAGVGALFLVGRGVQAL